MCETGISIVQEPEHVAYGNVRMEDVDEIVEAAAAAPGCVGARLMGAGFGGSILALVRRGAEREFETRLGRPVIFCGTADGPYSRAAA